MFITITGNLGSGKSTICKILAEKHGFAVYSTGAIHRSLAERMGLDTLRLNELMRSDAAYDNMIDAEVSRIAGERAGENIVFDSRLAWHFTPESFKVFMTVDPMVAARRVRAAERGPVEAYASDEDARDQLIKRALVENARFKEIYGVDNLDIGNFNLVLDATDRSANELAATIVERAAQFSDSPWHGPRNL